MRRKALRFIIRCLVRRGLCPLAHQLELPQITIRRQEAGVSLPRVPDRVEVMLIEEPRRAGISHEDGTPGLTSDSRHESLEIVTQLRTIYHRADLRNVV